MRILLPLSTLRRLLLWALAVVIYAGFWAELWDQVLRYEDPFLLVPFFGLSYETNLPTWFSCALLLSSAVMLALVGAERRRERARYAGHWRLLSLAFFYISLDELARLHERINPWMDAYFDLGGIFYFGWVIPAGIIVGILGLSYLGFLRALPARTRWRFVLAGVLYVGGALGVELLLGWWTDKAGEENFTYAMIDLVEESLEMLGASLFLYALVEMVAHPAEALEAGASRTQTGEVSRPHALGPGRLAAAAAVLLAPALLALWVGASSSPVVGPAIESLDVTVYTSQDDKEPDTVLYVQVVDARGRPLLQRLVGAGATWVAGGTHTLRLPFESAPARDACPDLTLQMRAAQARGVWSWRARLYVKALTSEAEEIRLGAYPVEAEFGSSRSASDNSWAMGFDCEPRRGSATPLRRPESLLPDGQELDSLLP